MMKAETKYAYQKRIKELELENCELQFCLTLYKDICSQIHTVTLDCIRDGKSISMAWMLRQFRQIWR
jgi:hypothetical protein